MKLLLCLSVSIVIFGVDASSNRRAFAIKPNAQLPDPTAGILPQARTFTTSSAHSTSVTPLRGGACDDTNAALLGKVGASVILQAAGLMGVFALGKAGEPILSNNSVPSIFGTSPALWAAFFVVIFASSFIGSFVDGGTSAALNQALDPNSTPGDPNWYPSLRKPSWNPPGWIFPIMWLIVSKPTQLLAVNRLWSVTTDGADRGWRLLAYCTYLALGNAWNKVFFGYQCIGAGLGVITAFFSMLLFSAFLFWQVDPLAGKFMLPTCGWVAVATSLNWSIYRLNRPGKTSN